MFHRSIVFAGMRNPEAEGLVLFATSPSASFLSKGLSMGDNFAIGTEVALGHSFCLDENGLWMPPSPLKEIVESENFITAQNAVHFEPAVLEAAFQQVASTYVEYAKSIAIPKHFKNRENVDVLKSIFPNVNEQAECPLGPGCARGDVWKIVQHLNDFHEWDRERIALWIESLPYDFSIQPTSIGD